MRAPASVISLTGRPGYRGDYRSLASGRIRAGRERLHMDYAGFAAHLSDAVGWEVTAGAVARWEQGSVPPGDVLLAAGEHVPERPILEAVPPSLAADTLAGLWVTCYRFSSPARFHADIARIEAVSARRVRITNSAPEPRTEGHAIPFRNEIEALLSSRHLTGHWKNTSDARYFGAIHLAVMPGETVMEGFYTNFADDVTVGTGAWKWARVEPGSFTGTDLAAVRLREPAEIGALLENHSYCDAPLSLTALGEVA